MLLVYGEHLAVFIICNAEQQIKAMSTLVFLFLVKKLVIVVFFVTM